MASKPPAGRKAAAPRLRESETLELKKTTAELGEAVVAVAAILNKHGRGRLYFGVKNSGDVVGQEISGQTLRDVSKALSEGIEPRVYPAVERISLQGKACVRVTFSGHDAPYLAHGRAYIRVGEESRQLAASELGRMFAGRGGDASRWESGESEKRLSDVKASALRAFVRRANLAGRLGFAFRSVRTTLQKLDLLSRGRLKRAAEVLFCDENPLEVQAAVFAGRDKTTFIDMKRFQGNLFDLLEKSETYLKEHLDWKVEFGALERKEIPEVPVDALREALVNSLCHRDYQNPKGNEVAVFRDRIEIYNPGDFPRGYTPADFLTGRERSILRNPLIAETFFKSKDIEKWGSGLKRISDECAKTGARVEFAVLKSGFLVTFPRRQSKDFAPRGGAKAGGAGSEKSSEKTRVKSSEKSSEKTRVKSSEKILAALARNPKASARKMAMALGLTQRAVEKQVSSLKAAGRLRRIGPDKGGRWEVQA